MNCLDTVNKRGQYAADSANSPEYAPKRFAPMKQAGRMTKKQLKQAMSELFDAGAIVVGDVGEYANRGKRRGVIRNPNL